MSASRMLLLCAVALGPLARAEDGALISAMDDGRFHAPEEKGAVEVVAGKVGKATHFRFDADARGVFCTSNLRGDPAWDRAEGFSFWVKGDGVDGFGGLEFIYDDDYAVRYDLAFPVKGDAWTKVTVSWRDLVSVLPGPRSRTLGTPGGPEPSKLSGLWFGKWWYWGDYPALGFAIDEIRLEPTIRRQPDPTPPEGPPLSRLLAKLKGEAPITVVTMGDSLTDLRHWSNREVAWPGLLKDRLKQKFGANVSVVNPAIGGTQLKQNLALIPTWLDKAPAPDLVTVFFGGNDWDAGMRGEEFEGVVADAIDRIRRATRGESDILILTTNPSAERREATAELAQACRVAAKARRAGLADTEAAFHAAGRDDRDRLFVHDRVHLSRAGHDVVVEAIMKAIEAGGR